MVSANTPVDTSGLLSENFRLKSALERSVAGIIVFDLERKITFVNAAWAGSHDYTPKELLGKPMKVFYSEKEHQKFERILGGTVGDGGVTVEMVHLKKNKDPLPVLARFFPTKDEKGDLNGFVISALDLTKQKRHERELLQKTKELEKFNKLFVDRELKMVELKKRIRQLEGKPPLKKKVAKKVSENR